MNYLLDTNLVIYAQKGVLAQPLPLGRYFVSIITAIELLSFPGLTPAQERALAGLLAEISEVGIDDGIKRQAIELRRRHHLRVPDAIIAATALVLDAELLTNDTKLCVLPGLRSRSLALRSG